MPATATLNRPAFTDVDSITAARFNSVTILSVIVPDATGAAEGVVRLAGDLTGSASAPQLATSGVTAGIYGSASTVPRITVDAKGRVTAAEAVAIPAPPAVPDATASVNGLVRLAGDLTGTAASPALATSGVTAGIYGTGATRKVPRITVDAKGRVTSATEQDIGEPTGAAGAFVNFDGNSTANFRAGLAYTRASNVVTITAAAHGFRVGDRVACSFTSGAATSGLHVVETVPNADTFTFSQVGANTGGNVTLQIYAIRRQFGVHSVVNDPAQANTYWVNFALDASNADYLLTGAAENYPGIYNATIHIYAPGGVAKQFARGFSLHSPAAAARNIHAVLFGT
jgi:hypothetical protein